MLFKSLSSLTSFRYLITNHLKYPQNTCSNARRIHFCVPEQNSRSMSWNMITLIIRIQNKVYEDDIMMLWSTKFPKLSQLRFCNSEAMSQVQSFSLEEYTSRYLNVLRMKCNCSCFPYIASLLESFHCVPQLAIFPLQADAYASARLGRTSLWGCTNLEQNTLSLSVTME